MDTRFPTAHRPYPPPRGAWIMAQSWLNVLLVHWAVPESDARRVLPPQLPLDTYNGQAWISIVAFNVKGFRPRWLPPLPRLSNFPEINVRTYVTINGKPGIYTFSLDVNNPFAVIGARLGFHLPYFRAEVDLSRQDSRFRFASARKGSTSNTAAFVAEYQPLSDIITHKKGTLTYWLTERYCLYSVGKTGTVYRTEIHHPAWELRAAQVDIRANSLTTAAGFSRFDSAPLFHYAERQDVILWLRQRL